MISASILGQFVGHLNNLTTVAAYIAIAVGYWLFILVESIGRCWTYNPNVIGPDDDNDDMDDDLSLNQETMTDNKMLHMKGLNTPEFQQLQVQVHNTDKLDR